MIYDMWNLQIRYIESELPRSEGLKPVTANGFFVGVDKTYKNHDTGCTILWLYPKPLHCTF